MFCNLHEEQLKLFECFRQAQLVSHAQQMGMDDSGTKNDLVERLLTTLSTEAVAQPFVQTNDRQVAPLACNIYKTLTCKDCLLGHLVQHHQQVRDCHPECIVYRRRFTSCKLK